ncbi:hypothetical protein LshimejAT787_0100060 [Lyophyllum shimeji]|uniref:F-box domain-containing protein n=1 Tax=Lyophyllum shimeji TaxID=47721 RepID=A0A9P3PCV8_LYOSH|nr:hypothetical protein LshimejAT787_0100060 [Lyophyllum shimeji]
MSKLSMANRSTVAAVHHPLRMPTSPNHLSLEVVGRILKLVQGADLAKCSYVSKAFAQIVEPLLYNNISLVISRSSASASRVLFSSLASSAARRSRVKTLTVIAVGGRLPYDFAIPRLSFPNLHTLVLKARRTEDTCWFNDEPTVIAFCAALLLQPTLRRWATSCLDSLPARFLFLPQHLTELTLDRTCVLSDEEDFDIIPRWVSLHRLQVSNSFFDTDCHPFLLKNPSQVLVSTLRNVEFHFAGFDMVTDLRDLLRSCGSSLRRLVIRITGRICATGLDLETLNLGALMVIETVLLVFDHWPNITAITTMLNTLPTPSLLTQMILTTSYMSNTEDWRSGDHFGLVASGMQKSGDEQERLRILID